MDLASSPQKAEREWGPVGPKVILESGLGVLNISE